MKGQMCWLAVGQGDGEKVLHIRLKPLDPWKPYTQFPHLSVPDYRIAGGSKGWATYQKLFRAGWSLIPSQSAKVVPLPILPETA